MTQYFSSISQYNPIFSNHLQDISRDLCRFEPRQALELRQGRRSNASTGSMAMDHSVAQKARAGGAVGNMAWLSCRNWCFDR